MRLVISLLIILCLGFPILGYSQSDIGESKIDKRLSNEAIRDTAINKKSKKKKSKTIGIAFDSSGAKYAMPVQSEVSEMKPQKGTLDTVIKKQEYKEPITDKKEIKADSPLVKQPEQKRKKENQDTIVKRQLTPEEIAEDLMNSGHMNFKGSNFEQAMFYFNKVISGYQATSQYAPAIYYRGKCRLSLNDEAGAITDISLFLKLDNYKTALSAEAYYTRGNLYFNKGDYSSAAIDFTGAAKDSTYRNYKFCFFYRAFCEGELKQYVPAVQDFTKFISIDNYKTISSAEALYYRGFYKVKLNDNRGAIKDYDKAIELYQYAMENVKDKSNVYLQKLIDTYITRALAKAEIKKFEEAIADYDAVIKINPTYATAMRLKGLAQIGKGDLDNGCLTLSKAGEMGSMEAYDDIKQHCK